MPTCSLNFFDTKINFSKRLLTILVQCLVDYSKIRRSLMISPGDGIIFQPKGFLDRIMPQDPSAQVPVCLVSEFHPGVRSKLLAGIGWLHTVRCLGNNLKAVLISDHSNSLWHIKCEGIKWYFSKSGNSLKASPFPQYRGNVENNM